MIVLTDKAVLSHLETQKGQGGKRRGHCAVVHNTNYDTWLCTTSVHRRVDAQLLMLDSDTSIKFCYMSPPPPPRPVAQLVASCMS